MFSGAFGEGEMFLIKWIVIFFGVRKKAFKRVS